ncbi:MAG: M23 family metallopeptidase [Holosporales bacterium]|jgi:murein DD-endopeptidase MepM/ murein hydrolase activator NlpD|nr:M23 family metallopeptidase [Holosporales bacterium]
MLAIKRSYFLSIFLLALAASIALTEYVMYSPAALSSDEETAIVEDEEDNEYGSSPLTDEESEDDTESEGKALQRQHNDDEATEPQSATVDTDKNSQTTPQQFPISGGSVSITIGNGDTFASILTKLGFSNNDIYAASKALSKVFNLRNLKIGNQITVKGYSKGDGFLVLSSIEMKPDILFKIIVLRDSNGKYEAEKVENNIKKVMKTISGTIAPTDPVRSLLVQGVRKNIAGEAVRALGTVVNVRSSREPVNFEFLCRDFYSEEGDYITSELAYASVLVRGQIFRLYKFKNGNSSEFIDQNGVTVSSMAKSKSMLAQPVVGRMKITSGYGVRLHPVYGMSKRHTGIDIKASVGTPIYAAANGRVAKASYFSGYGKYVRLAHGNGVDTAYGHLSRICVRSGQHVTQGQVIGYSGNTGITTGAHVHYEVLKNGNFINPLSFIRQEPQKLPQDKLIKFNQFKKQVNLQVVGLTPSVNKKATKIRKTA